MKVGYEGFLTASFSFGLHTTELANLLLLPVKPLKRPAAAKAKAGKKAKKAESSDVDADEEDADETSEVTEEKGCLLGVPPAPASWGGTPAAAAAAAAAPAPPPAPLPPAPPVHGPEADLYAMMYYKKSNTIGIREKFGNKQQIFGFGGKKEPVKTESQLRGIAKEIIMDMNMGMGKAYCVTKAKRLVSEE